MYKFKNGEEAKIGQEVKVTGTNNKTGEKLELTLELDEKLAERLVSKGVLLKVEDNIDTNPDFTINSVEPEITLTANDYVVQAAKFIADRDDVDIDFVLSSFAFTKSQSQLAYKTLIVKVLADVFAEGKTDADWLYPWGIDTATWTPIRVQKSTNCAKFVDYRTACTVINITKHLYD